jgi:anti-sigma B factor antagonist
MTPFETHVRTQGGTAVIDLSGEVNSGAEEGLSRAYSEAESSNPDVIVLNFSKVIYMNSSGIALIVGLLARARKANRRLVVYGLSEHYMEIFRITRLADYIHIYADEIAAMAG